MARIRVPTIRRACDFDLAGVQVGCAEYEDGPTGCTVLTLPKGSLVTADIRGGSPAVVMGLDGDVDAVCFAGGSLYGLEAAAGVTAALGRRNGVSGKLSSEAPVVRGACIDDIRAEAAEAYPDAALGAAAVDAAIAGRFPMGRVGAGRNAHVGKMDASGMFAAESGGQGAAFGRFTVNKKEFRVFVGVVVNSLGGLVDRAGNVVRGHLHQAQHRRAYVREFLDGIEFGSPPHRRVGNTTLSVVVTDCMMYDYYVRQAARQIHTSLARAIDPFHTVGDGDVLYLVRIPTLNAPCDRELNEATLKLGVLGAELIWDAVLQSWQ